MSVIKYQIDQNICRLCCENIGVISLFDSNATIQLCDKIMYCVKLQISENDCLPGFICTGCEEELTSTYNFVLKCKESDKKLRSFEFANIKTEYEAKLDIKLELDEQLITNDAEAHLYELHTEVKEGLKLSDECKKVHKLDIGILTKKKYVKRKNIKQKSNKSNLNKCKVCGRICNNPSTLLIHMRSHTNEKPHACTSCDKTYKESGSLKRHIQRNHLSGVRERKFICEQCGKGFFTKNDCKIHIRIHTGETPYACNLCPARFTQIGTLQKHQIRHTGERSHQCSTCNKTFSTKEQLKKHYVVHTTEKKYLCPICKGLFKYKNNLKKHVEMHSTSDVKKFICNYCGCGYALKGNLQAHIKRQHSSKSGFCENCLKYVPNLETHMWRHTGERPLKCELCSSAHFNLKGLTRHYNFRHKFADKYECTNDDCTLKFPSQPMLDYHITRYHISVKPFVCNKCSRGFYRKSDLARHKIGTHKERLE